MHSDHFHLGSLGGRCIWFDSVGIRFDIEKIRMPFSLILMGGQVVTCGRTELILTAKIIFFVENRSNSKVAIGEADCSGGVSW